MTKLAVTDSEVVVHLSPPGKVAAFRGDVHVPLAAVRDVEVQADPWNALRGVRSPCTGIPGVIAFGVRHFSGGRDFAAVVGKRPAVQVDLDGSSPFGRLVVTVSDPEATVDAVRAATGR